MVKNPPASAGDTGDSDSIPGSGRPPGGGNDQPLRYSCLENPKDRGAWRDTVHGVARVRPGLATGHEHRHKLDPTQGKAMQPAVDGICESVRCPHCLRVNDTNRKLFEH